MTCRPGAELTHDTWAQEVRGSNPRAPTNIPKE